VVGGRLSRLVNPGVPIPGAVTELTGIAEADVADAPSFAEVAGVLGPLIGDADLAGFNVHAYDLPLWGVGWLVLAHEKGVPHRRKLFFGLHVAGLFIDQRAVLHLHEGEPPVVGAVGEVGNQGRLAPLPGGIFELTLPRLKAGDSTIHPAEPTSSKALSVLPGCPGAFWGLAPRVRVCPTLRKFSAALPSRS
jgi:hypothetical protein